MNKNNVKAKLTKKIFLKWNMKFSNAIHSKVLCILCLFLSLYHVHCATFSFDLRSFIYRCKLLLMILHAWTAGWWRFWVKNWWKLCLRKKQAPASLTAKQNSVKTVSFLPHIWRENGQSSKYGRRRQIWTKPGKNTTHSSWNDEEQHPELLKELLAW